MDKKRKNNKVKKRIIKRVVISIIAIIIVISGSALGYIASIKKSVKKWDNKIYPGVQVYGVDLTGKTKEEAIEKLQEKSSEAINDKKIIVKVGDKIMEFSYSEISPGYDIEKTVNEALEYGKDQGILAKKDLIKNKNNEVYELPLEFYYDEEQLVNIQEKIEANVNIEPQRASISISGGEITIVPDVKGYKVNRDDLAEKLKSSINGNIGEDTVIDLELEVAYSDVTSSKLEKINGRLSTFSSDYSGSSEGRANNIAVATKVVNGTVLMPGEVYSYATETEKVRSQYKNASIFIGNESSEGLGGGICQVSTALYRALMRANIRSVERHNHSMTVYYAPLSLDATMAWGGVDYKFKNPYDSPIYIEGYTYNDVLTFNIYGDTSVLNGKTYDMVSEEIERIDPTTRYVDDDTLPAGTEVVDKYGVTGYRSKGYLVTYENGVEVNRELISTDSYMMVETVIRRGTKTDSSQSQVTTSDDDGNNDDNINENPQ